jgi:hypothetical protein
MRTQLTRYRRAAARFEAAGSTSAVGASQYGAAENDGSQLFWGRIEMLLGIEKMAATIRLRDTFNGVFALSMSKTGSSNQANAGAGRAFDFFRTSADQSWDVCA